MKCPAVLEAPAGSLLWLIKAELCFLSRAQSVKGFKREKLSFHFHSGVMDRTSRMKMRRRSLFKGQGPWRRRSSGSLLKVVTEEVPLAFRGGGALAFPQG